MKLAAIFLVMSLSGCATIAQKPIPITHAPKSVAKKHVEPCPCSPTAAQVIQKRWYDGFKVRWLH